MNVSVNIGWSGVLLFSKSVPLHGRVPHFTLLIGEERADREGTTVDVIRPAKFALFRKCGSDFIDCSSTWFSHGCVVNIEDRVSRR